MPSEQQQEAVKKTREKVVCGTNIISPDFDNWNMWKFPKMLKGYYNIIAMGVGAGYYYKSIDEKSRVIYKSIFGKKCIHSARDSYTKEMFISMGIKNVVVTGCPTMWRLTPSFCASIPVSKAKNVITTLTDYDKNPSKDLYLLNSLINEYDSVYLWLQGDTDMDYLSSLGDISNHLIIVSGDMFEFTNVLRQGNIDYIGTRLHAGIHAMNCGVRSLIVSIDNRAKEMANDFNLPIIDRASLEESLIDMIYVDRTTEIKLPWDNINKWKSQFNKTSH